MEISKLRVPQELGPVKVLDGENWLEKERIKFSDNDLIVSNLTSSQHDLLLNMKDEIDPLGLRGVMVTIVVRGRTPDDPKQMHLLAMPSSNDVLRHQDKHYVVERTLQGSNGSAAVYVRHMTTSEVAGLYSLPV